MYFIIGQQSLDTKEEIVGLVRSKINSTFILLFLWIDLYIFQITYIIFIFVNGFFVSWLYVNILLFKCWEAIRNIDNILVYKFGLCFTSSWWTLRLVYDNPNSGLSLDN